MTSARGKLVAVLAAAALAGGAVAIVLSTGSHSTPPTVASQIQMVCDRVANRAKARTAGMPMSAYVQTHGSGAVARAYRRLSRDATWAAQQVRHIQAPPVDRYSVDRIETDFVESGTVFAGIADAVRGRPTFDGAELVRRARAAARDLSRDGHEIGLSETCGAVY
jgi:hypothetical protein